MTLASTATNATLHEDTSHQCIDMLKDANGNSYLKVREEDCVGCNLCSIVCPVDGAIDMVELKSELPPMTWNERQAALGVLACGVDPVIK